MNAFTYQFVLENNIISFDFSQINIPSNFQIELTKPKEILSFDYRLTTEQSLPKDIPLFLVVFGQEVIFSADVNLADADFHTTQVNIKNFADYFDQLPVFYKNNVIENFKLEIANVTFVDQLYENKSLISITDLNVIREADNSLTVIFSVQEEIKNSHSYQLFCLNEKQEIIDSTKLNQKDNFLWPNFSFLSFYTNHKNELIFHLKEFSCNGSFYVTADDVFTSDRVSVIAAEDL